MQNVLKVDILEKFSLVNEYYTPKQVTVLNNTAVKIAKFKGPFTWHTHDNADELFWVLRGELSIEIKDSEPMTATENQFILIPQGVEHRPNPSNEAWVVLLEPDGLLNTGNVVNEHTVKDIEYI